jgi:hypothetical protein
MSQNHTGNVQPSLDNEEHDHLPGKVAVRKTGTYVWKEDDWQRQTEIATEATLAEVNESIQNLDITLTTSGFKKIRPESFTVIGGELLSGDIDSAKEKDNVYLKVAERTATGLSVEFTFNLDKKVQEFVFRGKYVGSPSHWIDIFAYDYSLATWVMISDASNRFSSGSTDITVTIPVLNDNFTDVNGETKVRLTHNTTSYNNNHYLDIDYMHAGYSEPLEIAVGDITVEPEREQSAQYIRDINGKISQIIYEDRIVDIVRDANGKISQKIVTYN